MRAREVIAIHTLGGCLLFLTACLLTLFISPLSPRNASALDLADYHFSDEATRVGLYDRVLAAQYYEAALAESPEIADLIQYQLGRIDFLEARFDEAIARFEYIIQTYGDSIPKTYYMLGLTYGYRAQWYGADADWVAAEENFTTFMNRSPDAPWPRVDLAWVYFSQGKYEAMKPILQEGLVYEPNNPWLLNMYGLALLNTNDPVLATEQFEKALTEIAKVSRDEWGSVYPGNNPASWSKGLLETRALIEQNLALSLERV